jgi:hypothetical protein
VKEFTVGDSHLLVDVDATRDWYAARGEIAGGCHCAYCRNFAAAIETFPQDVRALLASMGVDIRKPREIMEWGAGAGGLYPYEGIYHLAGTAPAGSCPSAVLAEGITAYFDEDCDLLPEDFPRPCFQLNVTMKLPWLLHEPKPEDM